MIRLFLLRIVRRDLFDLLTCIVLAVIFVLLTSGALFGQGNVGINNPTPHAKSLLDLTSTDKGLLTPRMTAAQRMAMFVAPDATGRGMLVYQTDGVQGFYYYDGTGWQLLQSGGAGWSLLGNVGIDPAVDYLGTADAQPVIFRSSALERMRIAANGNIGIGTAAPQVRLHVLGDVGDVLGNFRNINANGWSGLHFDNSTGTARAHIGFGNATAPFWPNMGYAGTTSAHPFVLTTANAERMRVTETGRVGIGTTAPSVRFELMDNAGLIPMRVRNTLNNGYAVTQYVNSGGTIGHIGWANPGAGNLPGLFFAGTQANAPFVFTTADQERLRLTADGKLGLHTTAPQADLDIISADPLLPALRVMNTLPNSASVARFSSNTGLAHFHVGFSSVTNTGTLGTSGANAVTISTNGMERMRVTEIGQVGIGTSVPLWKLDVHDVQSVGRFVSSGHANGSVVELRNLNPGAGGILGAVNFNNAADSYPGQIAYTASNAMIFRAGGMANERMRIDGATGNVGIGTATPTSALEVNGYTRLGSDAPAIRTKKLTGTTANAQGGNVDLPHGVTAGKIIGVQVLIEYTPGVWIPTSYSNVTGYSANFLVNATAVRILNEAGNSASILSKPVKVLITYEA